MYLSRLKCNSTIRLQHSDTKKWLSSNNFQSPLSGNGEVNCVDNNNEDVEWKVECIGNIYYIKKNSLVIK